MGRVALARLEEMIGTDPIESEWVFGWIMYPAANSVAKLLHDRELFWPPIALLG